MKPVTRTKLTESIIKAIMEYVNSQNLKVGDRLPSERDLSKALKVSRPLLREAIRVMEGLNLIEVKPGSGIFIKNPLGPDFSYLVLHIDLQEKERLLETLKVRKVLEKLAIEETLKNIDPEKLSRLEKLLTTLEEAIRRGDSGLEEIWNYYSTIYQFSNNKFLFSFLDGLKNIYLSWIDPQENPVFAEKTYSYHRELFEAIKNKDLNKISLLIDRFYKIWQEEIEKRYR
ncbi:MULTISPECIES: FadR/GntR family transcriptional regulator [Dictyoglomus]|jgi:DNA-binding FadR family transcriptional regulator|uniref:Regulatory protein GntR HTH n=1 Tax=Dictyoglomus turgidum (strain DSM 6724 / Z-1310) TaxID=515635 RepID=B8E213_DICTD|nr:MULTISPECIES: FadR/GntR family transcriptional regulator [Dictyoglomus]ACK41796.1 regulatory protein GntR HTH [Dictyoglomus turgidum DSM 6724]PNV78974.1 MAG: FadR family transcriptional regulator [Dictyoglomus turgidum]HBU31352.1 FadR family transcriptional regulator [Dictyoglomus sp.]